MTKYTCDRCGYEATEAAVMTRLVVTSRRHGRPWPGQQTGFANDLCCDCAQAVQKFIKDQPKGE